MKNYWPPFLQKENKEDDDGEESDDVLKEVLIGDWMARIELPEPFYELSEVIVQPDVAEKMGVYLETLEAFTEYMRSGGFL